MRFKWTISNSVLASIIFIAFYALAGHDSVVAAQDGLSKIEPTLLDEFTSEGSADFIIRFAEQADLSAAYSMSWEERGEYVYNTLRNTALKTQVNARAILDSAGSRYETYIAGNEIYVWAGMLTEATTLGALPEVDFIRATRTYSIDPVTDETLPGKVAWAGELLEHHAITTVGSSLDSTAWGITYTKADQFWMEFGAKGKGIKLANIDTGVQYNHPALDQSFACPGQPNNPACWKDPSNICGSAGVCDNNGHGTHTMGTMVGDDDASLTYETGMAPDAKWIACKGCESTSCSDFALNACADWILAPGGNFANRPNIVNNSWGGGGGDSWYLAKVEAWRAAGIFPAFSAGNSGPGCGTLGSPGDYQESFSSAAVDLFGDIAYFSSRGPNAYGHDPYTKPNIAAPGVNICSSVPGNGWSCMSGTSMASPHSAGAVALLWSCNPALIGKIDDTFEILQNTASNAPAGFCGAPPDTEGNYSYGYGYLDVLSAGQSACTWTEIPPDGCPDWTEYDGDYFPGTGLVYFMGGKSRMGTVGTIYSLNPDTHTCIDTGADMPVPISNYTINVVNDGAKDLLCTFGGQGADGLPILDVQCYDPFANSASSVTNLPTAYAGYSPGAQVVVDNRVYLFGGFGIDASPHELIRTDRYNPVTHTFIKIGDLSLARSNIDAAVVDGKIYAFGGAIYNGISLSPQTRTEVMADPGGAGTWNDTALKELPAATAEGRASGFDSDSFYELAGKVVIAGGGVLSSETGEVFVYDTNTNTYNYGFSDLVNARRDHAGVFIPVSDDGPAAMWVFGGSAGADTPSHAYPEYFTVGLEVNSFLSLILR